MKKKKKTRGYLQNAKHAPIQLEYAYVSRSFETAECATWLYLYTHQENSGANQRLLPDNDIT